MIDLSEVGTLCFYRYQRTLQRPLWRLSARDPRPGWIRGLRANYKTPELDDLPFPKAGTWQEKIDGQVQLQAGFDGAIRTVNVSSHYGVVLVLQI